MTRDRDDDALTWDGDGDPTLAPAPKSASASGDGMRLPKGFTPVGKGADAVEQTSDADAGSGTALDDVDHGEPAGMGNATLVTIGVLGGVYALWTIGWVIGGLRLQGTAQYLVSPLAYVPSLWLAVLAPAIWFGAAYALTRRSRAWLRLTWLIAGAVLLVPWPFVMTGAVGQ